MGITAATKRERKNGSMGWIVGKRKKNLFHFYSIFNDMSLFYWMCHYF